MAAGRTQSCRTGRRVHADPSALQERQTGKVIRPEWTQLHFPLFYFYDVLQGLRVVTALGFGRDERTKDARELLLSKRLPAGTWPMEATYLRALRRNLVTDQKT